MGFGGLNHTDDDDLVPKSLYEGEKHRADRCETAMRAAIARAEQAESRLAKLIAAVHESLVDALK